MESSESSKGIWSDPRAAVALAGAGGVAGAGIAAFGLPIIGVALAVAAIGVALPLAKVKSRHKAPETIKELIQIGSEEELELQKVSYQLLDMLQKVESHGESIRNIVRYLQEHATLVAWLIDNFDQAAKDANKQLEAIRGSAGEVSDRGAKVLEGSRTGLDFVNTIGASTKTLAGEADNLSTSAKSTTAIVAELQAAYDNAEAAIIKLAEVSDHSTQFVAEVGRTMGSIRESAHQSLDLFGNVEEYARRGREVVGMVGAGVEDIMRSTEETREHINDLSTQSRQIEDILGIINEVADETSLLALNAAILAAQAGEKGAAFGVVADQIRSLAHRTRESIDHIETIVRSVQKKVKEANDKMTLSFDAVNQGQTMGREAVVQLDKIEKAVNEAVDQARSIALSVEKQDNMSSQMVAISTEVNLELHGVASILRQSSGEMDRMGHLIKEVSELAAKVRQATDGNHRSAMEVAELMDTFLGQMEEIETLVLKQKTGVATLDQTMTSVEESADATRESLVSIHKIVNELVSHADSLRAEVEACGVTQATGENRHLSATTFEAS